MLCRRGFQMIAQQAVNIAADQVVIDAGSGHGMHNAIHIFMADLTGFFTGQKIFDAQKSVVFGKRHGSDLDDG
ncbi:MAG: hypothetical protein R3E89_04495 [Thiolinea sp.]